MVATARLISKINPAKINPFWIYPAGTYLAIAQHGKTADNPGNRDF
jgi:hypothetical protein